MNQQKESKQTEKRGEAFAPRSFVMMQEISRSDISGISTKAPCEVALIGERHVRIEISDFVMRAFVLTLMKDSLLTVFFFFVETRQRLYFPKGWFPEILYAASPQGRKP